MQYLEKYFSLKNAGTTVRTEVLAGFTTFMTMSYIIFVHPSILQNAGMPFGSVLTTTCLISAMATLLMAFLANYPIALAPGMGVNAFFTFTVVLAMKVPWQVALAAVFIEGILFAVLTLTNFREAILNAIPQSLKIAISCGIGLFIIFIGLQTSGIIVKDAATMVKLGDFKNSFVPLLSFFGFLLMVVLTYYRVVGAMLIGILTVTFLAVLVGVAKMPQGIVSMPPSVEPIFFQFDFSQIWTTGFWLIVMTLFFVDFFNSLGTVIGVAIRGNLLDKDGNLPRAKYALLTDALGTTFGSVLGTSTVSSYVESASGVEQGGRTGLVSVVVAVLFLLAMFFSPIISIVPACATAPALILTGIYMFKGFKELDTEDWTEFVPAVLTVLFMPFSYSISVGIEVGVVSYVLLKFFCGKKKSLSMPMIFLAGMFILVRAFL